MGTVSTPSLSLPAKIASWTVEIHSEVFMAEITWRLGLLLKHPREGGWFWWRRRQPRPGEEYMQQDGPNVAVEASSWVCGRLLCYYLYFVLCLKSFIMRSLGGKNTTEEKKASLDKISKRLHLSCLLSERFSLAKASIRDEILTVQLFFYYINGHLLTNRPWTRSIYTTS